MFLSQPDSCIQELIKKEPVDFPVLLCFVQERLFLVILPDFHTTDFTADSFRKFLYKFYNARVFVRSGYSFNMVLQLLNQLFTGAVLVLFG